MKHKRQPKRSYPVKSFLLSALLHIILIIALVWGSDFNQEKPKPVGSIVQAVVIDPQLVRQQAQEIKTRREAAAKKEQNRLDKLRRESVRLEQNRKNEEERIRKLKEQKAKDAKAAREAEKFRKKKEQQRIAEEKRAAKAEAARKLKEAAIAKAEKERLDREKAAKIAAEKAKKEQEAARKAEQERLAKEKAAKVAAEKARKEKARLKKLEAERKERERALNDIFSGLETESQQNSSARNHYVADQANRYGAIYTKLIQSRLLLEDSFKGKSCRINLHLIPAGKSAIVGSVKILKGSQPVCAATRRAVAQVNFFPLPNDPDVVKEIKDITLNVKL
ncbi:cell envelope integrity protein TolA [Vibrio quintilis]|uniref:Cell envelope integrity inner membrane protein TolA n=1 Tax=Vibrio quintilis TaxID=1117707 RepID=A0A1M7Z1L8_9VIBR|nr:cell envelope integrity protein TolA [Vibrio quintilis]SHO58847.1 cell envelope integrity inner membrane protein TolA [Vibrio quintilis]